MTLTNYWWLLIWVFIAGAFFTILFPKQREIVLGKQEERWRVFPAILLVLPYIIWAGFRTDAFGDTIAYRRGFQNAPSQLGQLTEYLATITKDKGYSVFSVLIKCIIGNSDILFFLIIASIQLGCIVYVCRKYSCNYWMSIFLFIASTEYVGWMHNGIRQFLAITLIFAATDFLVEKKYISMIMVILIAATFHASALFMIPIIFIVQGKAWNKKTILCILACILALFFVDRFTDILDSALSSTQYSGMVTDWQEWEDDGTNPIRVFIYSIPMLLSVVGYKYIKYEENPIVHIATNFSVLACGIGLISMVTSGIFLGRMIEYASIYSLLLLLPWEIENFFTPKSSQIVYGAMIVGYVAFFYYQMHFSWGLL